MATKRGTNTDDNSLRGTRGADEFYGLGGNDKLWGLAGRDVLHGGAGNDVLISMVDGSFLKGGVGADILIGNNSKLVYWGSEGVTVNLAEGTAHGGFAAVYDSDGKVLRSDTFTSIESLWGSQDDAVLTGDSKNNLFDGHAGDDVLEGRGGADRLFRGGGSNGGNDTASYAGSPGGVTR